MVGDYNVRRKFKLPMIHTGIYPGTLYSLKIFVSKPWVVILCQRTITQLIEHSHCKFSASQLDLCESEMLMEKY